LAVTDPTGTLGLVSNAGSPIGAPLIVGPGAVSAIAWPPDGAGLASGTDNGVVEIRSNGADGSAQPIVTGTAAVTAISWPAPDDLVRVAADGAVTTWTPAGRSGATFAMPDGATAWAWAPDGTSLAVGGADGAVSLWSPDGVPGQQLVGAGPAVTAVAWSGDGQSIVVADASGAARQWSADGLPMGTPLKLGAAAIGAIAVSAHGQSLAVVRAGDVEVVGLDSPDATRRLSVPGTVQAVTWSPVDDDLLALGFEDGSGVLIDARSVTELAQISSADFSAISALAFSPDGARLALGTVSGASTILYSLSTEATCTLLTGIFSPEQMIDIVGAGGTSVCDPDRSYPDLTPLPFLSRLPS
jgi:WD40 repeat protein